MQLQVLYDIYESKRAGEDFTLFTLDDVDEAFETKTGERFVQLKYSQHYNLTGTQVALESRRCPLTHSTEEGRGIRITPYSSGRTFHAKGGVFLLRCVFFVSRHGRWYYLEDCQGDGRDHLRC